MFNFPDDVVLEEYKGEDKMNTAVYESPKVVKMKLAYEGYRQVIKNGNTASEWCRIYHSPFEVNEKSVVDNLRIEEVTHCKSPVDGVMYWRVVAK